MRFLADESCDFAAVRVLRLAGHDVLAVAELQQRSVDQEVLRLAVEEQRVLLTEDKDFGQLVFAAQMESPGVILIRYPASARASLAMAVQKLAADHEAQLRGCFVVLAPGIIRMTRR